MSKNRDRQRENRRKYKGDVSSKATGYRDTTASAAINAVMKRKKSGLRSLPEFPVCRREQSLTLWQGLRSRSLALCAGLQRDLASVSMSFVRMRSTMRYPFQRIPLQS